MGWVLTLRCGRCGVAANPVGITEDRLDLHDHREEVEFRAKKHQGWVVDCLGRWSCRECARIASTSALVASPAAGS
jgi:hypothetical protein